MVKVSMSEKDRSGRNIRPDVLFHCLQDVLRISLGSGVDKNPSLTRADDVAIGDAGWDSHHFRCDQFRVAHDSPESREMRRFWLALRTRFSRSFIGIPRTQGASCPIYSDEHTTTLECTVP